MAMCCQSGRASASALKAPHHRRLSAAATAVVAHVMDVIVTGVKAEATAKVVVAHAVTVATAVARVRVAPVAPVWVAPEARGLVALAPAVWVALVARAQALRVALARVRVALVARAPHARRLARDLRQTRR